MTAHDLITAALREIRVVNAADAATADDAELGLVHLNRLVDDWTAQGWGVGLGELTLTDELTITPGYLSALLLTLAESLAGPFGVEVPPLLVRDASKARARVVALNQPDLTTTTDTPGLRRGFDYLTGRVV